MKLDNIKSFATPEELAQKVVTVETSKEGVKDVYVVGASEGTIKVKSDRGVGDKEIPAYDIEYKVDSTRGFNHYCVKATIYDSNLYVFTAQSKEDMYEQLEPVIKAIVQSFGLGNS